MKGSGENTLRLKHCFCMLALSVGLAACSTTPIDLPAVSAAGQADSLPGKIIWHDLISDTPQETRAFYSGLFNWDFSPLDSLAGNYTLISHDGNYIGGMVDESRLGSSEDISQWVVVVAVTDVTAATAALTAAGGKVFTEPTSLGARGEIAVVADPQGALLALLQTNGEDPADTQDVAANSFLWNELWTENVDAAATFYQRIAPYTVKSFSLISPAGPVPYRVMSAQGRARAGIRSNPVPGMSPTWQSYLSVDSLEQLESVIARVPALGGTVLMPATKRPEGGYVAVIAGPSGAGIALQTWPVDMPTQASFEYGEQ